VRERVDLWRTMVRLAAVRLYRRGVLGYAAQTFAIGGFGYWAPTFLFRRYDLPLDKGSATFGAVLVVAGGLGTALGGWLTDRRIARAGATGDDEASARIALRLCAWTSVLGAPLAAACFWAPTPTIFFALAFACDFAIFTSTSPINSVLLRTVPTELRASAMALSIFSIHLLGDLWSPPLLGLAQDALPISTAMMGVPVAIAVSAALWWIGAEPATSRGPRAVGR
jgi:hypothetical protein